MSQAGAWGPANQLNTLYEVDAVVPEAIQITAEDRVMDRDANETTLTLTVEGSTSVNLSPVTAVLQRQTDTTGNFAIVTDNSVTLTSSADKKTHTVTAYFSTQTVPAGLYRVAFTVDGVVQYFYFIIT